MAITSFRCFPFIVHFSEKQGRSRWIFWGHLKPRQGVPPAPLLIYQCGAVDTNAEVARVIGAGLELGGAAGGAEDGESDRFAGLSGVRWERERVICPAGRN